MRPYLDTSGCIQTNQLLPEAPPRGMIPKSVLGWEDLYHKGLVSVAHGMTRERVYNARRVLRRYHLLAPVARNCYTDKPPEVQREMRRDKQRRYRQERRLQAAAATAVH
jgi:hypothetical protein